LPKIAWQLLQEQAKFDSWGVSLVNEKIGLPSAINAGGLTIKGVQGEKVKP